jgi:hypothetical protein
MPPRSPSLTDLVTPCAQSKSPPDPAGSTSPRRKSTGTPDKPHTIPPTNAPSPAPGRAQPQRQLNLLGCRRAGRVAPLTPGYSHTHRSAEAGLCPPGSTGHSDPPGSCHPDPPLASASAADPNGKPARRRKQMPNAALDLAQNRKQRSVFRRRILRNSSPPPHYTARTFSSPESGIAPTPGSSRSRSRIPPSTLGPHRSLSPLASPSESATPLPPRLVRVLTCTFPGRASAVFGMLMNSTPSFSLAFTRLESIFTGNRSMRLNLPAPHSHYWARAVPARRGKPHCS